MSITALHRTLADNPSPFVVETPVVVAQGASSTTTTNASDAPHSVQTPAPDALRTQQADQQNLRNLAAQLRGIDTRAHGKPVTPDAVLSGLNNSRLTAQKDSAYAHVQPTAQTLATVITHLGFELPRTVEEVAALAQKLEQKASQHPLGDFGGALTWPIPMAPADQHSLRAFLKSDTTGLPGLPLPPHGNGVLTYLLSGSSVSQSDLQDPTVAVQKLLDSPKARALGQALQDHLQGAATDTSLYDYVLAAIHLGLDPESLKSPERNKIAEWPLHDPDHWGQPPSEVVACLSRHLEKNGRANSKTVKLATHLLLSRVAPQFLIKDIPDSVKIGSVAWFNLTVAAAAIEAERPGTVANMTFAEVMCDAQKCAPSPANAHAQTRALVDWGVASGVLVKNADDSYSPEQLNTLQAAFNRQVNRRLVAGQTLDDALPTREGIARARLIERFGDLGELFDAKVLGTDQYRGEPGQVGLGGLHSLLDIAMMDMPNPRPFMSTDPRIPLEALNSNPRFGVREEFDQQFARAIAEKKDAVATTVQHMISQLPLEDRKKFQFGKLEFFYEGSSRLSTGFWGSTPDKNKPQLLVKVELEGQITTYEIDLNRGTIEWAPLSRITEPKPRQADRVFTVNQVKLEGAGSRLSMEQPVTEGPLDSFNSGRSYRIGTVFAEHLELDDPAIKEQARGQTTLDKLEGGPKPLSDFLLNLIPFRSAVINFKKGNYGDGIFDLTLDIFGFLSAGAATAGKLIKIGGSALTAGAKGLKAVQIIGAATLGLLNPVSGLGDLAVGGLKLLGKGGNYLLSKGADAISALKTASKSHGVVATGTFKLAEQSVEGMAVFREGKWYGYNPVSDRPYGPPLKDFTPQIAALEGEIKLSFTESWLGKMIGSVVAPPANNPHFRSDFIRATTNANLTDRAAYIRGQNSGRPEAIYGYSSALNVDDLKRLAVAEHRTPAELGSLVKRIDELETLPLRLDTARDTAKLSDPLAYANGYKTGKPEGIKGFSDTLTSNQLAELVAARGRTAEEVGQLVKYMETRRINISLENFQVFSAEITAAGGKVTPLPQGMYLSQVSLLSEGECAALSNVMAAAIKNNNKSQERLIKNLYAAMTPKLSAREIAELRQLGKNQQANIEQAKLAFRDNLNQLQGALGSKFHLGRQSRQVPYTTIISELANARSDKTLLISGPSHGITAGVVTVNGRKEWFYFDPNFGKATFDTQAAMSAALESTLSTGRTKNLLAHFVGQNPGVPEYRISTFDPADLNNITAPLNIDVMKFFQTDL
ncbi:hypothetical protein [Pseudomonas salomonii]|uniref:Peptidase C58 YopT-type domain-containing protein n=1 Tax=Pseudomonas salomonii TaxID=191391 RepID=A0ABS9GJ90_9PSED|nr:hypothetical protein [Pseudomonas salomonii]MCF5545820.1 hypothetical protein [Pseudomonas salomonii]